MTRAQHVIRQQLWEQYRRATADLLRFKSLAKRLHRQREEVLRVLVVAYGDDVDLRDLRAFDGEIKDKFKETFGEAIDG